ncbi:hypothetical protein [Natronococcus jeotgali]|uniref:Uncharacterized protein n=1 Tax=Natronococcus jeotgali DSM 18795 TaxID=1227498 RepID=L9X9U2_9EURY|nr:hypothetical protein [Natronococcus jeotgali]ELY58494.1 hypothetical protein C492_11785 [Natronococcus jeotgali DSM 18795]
MSTRPHTTPTEPTPSQPTTRTTRPTASERAPATFSNGHTDRLQNLIDEWNTAFADGASGE